MTITEFIEAQLARERSYWDTTEVISPRPGVMVNARTTDGGRTFVSVHGQPITDLIEAYRWEYRRCLEDPGYLRWKRRDAAIRAVVELHRTWADDPWPECEVCRRPPPCQTVRAIAGIWADQPGYDEGWRA